MNSIICFVRRPSVNHAGLNECMIEQQKAKKGLSIAVYIQYKRVVVNGAITNAALLRPAQAAEDTQAIISSTNQSPLFRKQADSDDSDTQRTLKWYGQLRD